MPSSTNLPARPVWHLDPGPLRPLVDQFRKLRGKNFGCLHPIVFNARSLLAGGCAMPNSWWKKDKDIKAFKSGWETAGEGKSTGMRIFYSTYNERAAFMDGWLSYFEALPADRRSHEASLKPDE